MPPLGSPNRGAPHVLLGSPDRSAPCVLLGSLDGVAPDRDGRHVLSGGGVPTPSTDHQAPISSTIGFKCIASGIKYHAKFKSMFSRTVWAL